MKPLSKALLSLVILLVSGSVGGYFYMRRQFQPAANQLRLPLLPATCAFRWQADTVARLVVPHAALLVPVALPGCPRVCYLQFDTGAPSSVLYANPLAALRARYPRTRQVLLPRGDTLRNVRFILGQQAVHAPWLRLLPVGARHLPDDAATPFIVGTLGADVLDGRVLVLDYARRRFSLCPRVPDSLTRRTAFVPLAYTGRRLLVTVGLQGRAQQLLFDSGSSAFALLTSPATWHQLARPHAPARTSGVHSWGKTLTAHTVATDTTLRMGTTRVPLRTVTYVEGIRFWQTVLMRFSGMGGMLGNEPFAVHTIVIDTPGNRFGVAQP